jgi:hypothetical protein
LRNPARHQSLAVSGTLTEILLPARDMGKVLPEAAVAG